MLMIMMKLILTRFVIILFMMKYLMVRLLSLEFKIEVNNFPTQLISVIARKLSGSDGFPLFL
jgi:hypothetical protein